MKLAIFFSLLLLATGIFHSTPVAAGDNDKNRQTVSRNGEHAWSKASADYFTGNAFVENLFSAADYRPVGGAYVTFEPGAHTNWHVHPAGQTLVVTSGVGLTQEWGRPASKIKAGDVVQCPPGIKHWHGAAPNSAMTHLAMSGTLDGKSVEWMERVADEQYEKAAK